MKVTIIEEYGNSCYILKCAFCEGGGLSPSSWGGYSTNSCEVCNGKGVVGVQIIDGTPPFFICKKCEGSGREPSSWGGYTTNPCRACHGVGGQPITGHMQVL